MQESICGLLEGGLMNLKMEVCWYTNMYLVMTLVSTIMLCHKQPYSDVIMLLCYDPIARRLVPNSQPNILIYAAGRTSLHGDYYCIYSRTFLEAIRSVPLPMSRSIILVMLLHCHTQETGSAHSSGCQLFITLSYNVVFLWLNSLRPSDGYMRH